MNNLYSSMSREELYSVFGGDPSEVDETVASLIEKKVIQEHHDGGFTFNPVDVDALLDSFCHPEDRDVWLG